MEAALTEGADLSVGQVLVLVQPRLLLIDRQVGVAYGARADVAEFVRRQVVWVNALGRGTFSPAGCTSLCGLVGASLHASGVLGQHGVHFGNGLGHG